MATARKQAKRQKTAPRTPKRKVPERLVIGSSSTWKEEELERFNVRIGGEFDAKTLVPEKWFDFDGLDGYQSGTVP